LRLSQVLNPNRSAEVGALSASFAHELSQPLAAIMVNVASAEALLGASSQNDGHLRSVLADTRDAAQHAIDVIQQLRKLLKRGSETELEDFDLSEVIAGAVHILRPEATKRKGRLQENGIRGPLPVRADLHTIQP